MQLGISDDELKAARQFEANDPKIDAALKFVKAVLEKRGHVEDSDIEAARGSGYDDGDIIELVTNVVLNFLTNYINHTAKTDIDFPLAPDLP